MQEYHPDGGRILARQEGRKRFGSEIFSLKRQYLKGVTISESILNGGENTAGGELPGVKIFLATIFSRIHFIYSFFTTFLRNVS